MTSNKQKEIVLFCENILQITFKGNIDSKEEVESFIDENFQYAKELQEEMSTTYSYCLTQMMC